MFRSYLDHKKVGNLKAKFTQRTPTNTNENQYIKKLSRILYLSSMKAGILYQNFATRIKILRKLQPPFAKDHS